MYKQLDILCFVHKTFSLALFLICLNTFYILESRFSFLFTHTLFVRLQEYLRFSSIYTNVVTYTIYIHIAQLDLTSYLVYNIYHNDTISNTVNKFVIQFLNLIHDSVVRILRTSCLQILKKKNFN